MAFFYKIKDKLQSVVNLVTTKVKGFSSVGILNHKKSDLEAKIDSLYNEIGKTYYADNKNNPNDPYSYYLRQIAVISADVESFDRQICIMKGKRMCPNCSHEIPAKAMFCSFCGAKIPSDVANNDNSFFRDDRMHQPMDFNRQQMSGREVMHKVDQVNIKDSFGGNMQQSDVMMHSTGQHMYQSSVPVRKKVCPICGNPESFTATVCSNCGCHL